MQQSQNIFQEHFSRIIVLNDFVFTTLDCLLELTLKELHKVLQHL